MAGVYGAHRYGLPSQRCVKRVYVGANHPIQSAAGGILKLATAAAWEVCKAYKAAGKYLEPLMSIHDELLFELDEALKDDVERDIKPCFENAYKLRVAVGSGVAFEWGARRNDR